MIAVITSCSYFREGFHELTRQILAECKSFSQVTYTNNINTFTKKILGQTKAIVVDYGQSDIQQLIDLLIVKNKYPDSYFIFITRESCFENTIENILINTVSDYSIDCVSVMRKLKACLKDFADGNQHIIVTKNRRLYHIEKEKNLTKRESDLLPYIISGRNNKEISRYLDVSGKTVSHHRRNIYQKFAVNNLTGLYNVFGRYV